MTNYEVKEKCKVPWEVKQLGTDSPIHTPPRSSPKNTAFAHAWCARVAPDGGTLARRAVQAEKMAPPSPQESKAPSSTSEAKSDEEMVLPGFPDADSFVKVSSWYLGGAGSRPR